MATVFRDYVVQHELAHEPSATILKAVRKTTNETVVLKCPTPHSTQTSRELTFLSGCHHPHIIPMIASIQTANGPVIVLPFARGGDLFSLLENSELDEHFMKAASYNVLTALAYLHENKIVHRDIKPENILFRSETICPDSIVLADFGCAQRADELSEPCGTLDYAAPEIVRQNERIGTKVDIWALGITLYVCLTGHFPFAAETAAGISREIREGLPAIFAFQSTQKLSADCKDLIDWLLTPSPTERPHAKLAMAHPWFDDVRPPIEQNR